MNYKNKLKNVMRFMFEELEKVVNRKNHRLYMRQYRKKNKQKSNIFNLNEQRTTHKGDNFAHVFILELFGLLLSFNSGADRSAILRSYGLP